jgi:hypothetical protein
VEGRLFAHMLTDKARKRTRQCLRGKFTYTLTSFQVIGDLHEKDIPPTYLRDAHNSTGNLTCCAQFTQVGSQKRN